MKKILLLLNICIFILGKEIHAQTNFPYYQDIQEFKKKDSLKFPPKNGILFIGSSTFTKWKDVQAYFPGYSIINRGFGGSTLLDEIRYVPDIVYPYHPRQVIIYCGDNDFAFSDTVTSADVLNRFKILFELIRKEYPAIPVDYISIKYSPSREKLWNKMKSANRLISNYLKTQIHAEYIDIDPVMLDANKKINKSLYLDDMLHMKPEGYRLWEKVIKPYLIKD
ncbi:GDSL-type esterase/lipase family protein [Rhizosphaericola mali]|uniref:G-D-S-L family lipolytic protein n=1 Tax=Rhizosphaericola mali TaxID=2545455 RepID=A0A5P2G1D0_9BACT|nr:GDSL-type esterase/lipase family protein [Rhizosphaericola mali]QES89604.1 G-D-S-L family lipolytic protein [Rhizosphaericola mali]